MTPKQIVLEKHPTAKCFTDKGRFQIESKSIVSAKNGALSIIVLGEGKDTRQAWASAAETVRRGK